MCVFRFSRYRSITGLAYGLYIFIGFVVWDSWFCSKLVDPLLVIMGQDAAVACPLQSAAGLSQLSLPHEINLGFIFDEHVTSSDSTLSSLELSRR